jgi:outer membrane lipoprotein-sorting protein
MKKIILLLTISLLVFPLSGQFKAKMYFTSMGKDHVFTVYSADAGYRYEFNEDGQAGVIIAKKGADDIIILMPQQKMAMKSSATDKMSMGNDPVAAYKYYQDQGLIKVEGPETVSGIACTRSGLWNKDNPNQKMFTIWTSEEYNFPVKLTNHISGSDDTTMELKDVEPWTPDPGYFEIPDGYQVMYMSGMQGKQN